MAGIEDQEFARPTGSIEVRVVRGADELAREICESETDAAAVVARWEDVDGVECFVSDLSATEGDPSEMEVEPPEDGYTPG